MNNTTDLVVCLMLLIICVGSVGWDQQLLLVTYGKHFRTMRKLAHHHLGTKVAAVAYHEVQETEVKF